VLSVTTTLGADRVDLVNEDRRWRVVPRHLERGVSYVDPALRTVRNDGSPYLEQNPDHALTLATKL
jgi:hypothetical protein